jgi:exodeoxyribonuclease VII small subunit
MSNNVKTFEQKMDRLEAIVKAMERGDVPLDESLKLFQEGTALVDQCTKLLDEAEQKVKIITSGCNEEPKMEDFQNVPEL